MGRFATGLMLIAFVGAAAVHGAGATDGGKPTGKPFGLASVRAKAQQLARSPFSVPARVPEWLQEISYDEWRDIRFRPAAALWRTEKLPFEMQFFHTGLYYDRSVDISVVDAQGAHALAFDPSQFDYGENTFASRIPHDIGFAGFRLHYPLNRTDYKDELIAFLGASYFRALARNAVFGISARGIAVDTASPSGEEFPYFREFWLVRPARQAKEIECFALLDSPRLTGAYRFVIFPGVETIVDVEATLYLREPIEKLGIAPLTSMFFFGEGTWQRPLDYRPEVHDSDGLLIAQKSGEWLWRPLDNPARLRVSAFQSAALAGFGLLQRDRQFDHFQDLETHAERRPGVWIEPRGEWGAGHVELVEIPTNEEIHDNIVAFWVAKSPATPDEPVDVAYRMVWHLDSSRWPPGGRAIATRRDGGTSDGAQRVVVDFAGKTLATLAETTVVEGVVDLRSAGGGEVRLLEQQVRKNPATEGWRLTFQFHADDSHPVEMRAFLRHGADVLTETWTYVIDP